MFALFMIVGCSDNVTDHYANRTKAEKDHLFERGWLPSIIPTSARDITTSNDLDINISEGEFRYDPKETNEFLRYLKLYSGQKPMVDSWQADIAKHQKEGYSSFEYASDKTVWIFLVNVRTGHVHYLMWISR